MKYKIFIVLGLLVNQFYGQDSLLKIKVINTETTEAVANANVIRNDNYIGQSDEKGFFSFQKKDSATILISHILYESIKFRADVISKDTMVIKLNPKNILLEEVLVTSKTDSLFSNDDKNKIKLYAKKFTKLYAGYLQMAKVHEERAMYIEDDMVAFLECNSFLLPAAKTVGNSLLTAVPKSHARFLVNPKFKNFILSGKSSSFLLSTGHFFELRRYLDYNPMLLKNLSNYVYKIVSEDENVVRIKYNFRKDKKLNLSRKINGVLTINKKLNLLEEFTYVCNINYDEMQTKNSATIFFKNNNNSIHCSGGKSEFINLDKNTRIKYVFDLLSNNGPNTFVGDRYNIMSYSLKDLTNYDINDWKSFPIKNSTFLSDILTFHKNYDIENEFKLGSEYLSQLNGNLKGYLKIEQDALNKIYPQFIKQIQTKLKIEL